MALVEAMLLYEVDEKQMCIRQLHCSILSTMKNRNHFVTCSRLAILLWTSLVVVLCNCSPSSGCPSEEYEALLELRSFILHNSGTLPPTWGRRRECCLWERVTCNNSTRQVSKLMLSGLRIEVYQGSPLNFSIFSSFHELRLLNLSDNFIQGLQTQIGISGLRKLEVLDLSYNNVIGTVPLFLRNLSSLNVLNLSNNGIDIFNVADISGLRKLEVLDLSYNNVIGIVPLFLKNLSSLNVLNLRNNMLNGTLNGEVLLGLQKLRVLDLGYNHLTGGIPTALGNLSSLNFLYLDQNNLTGSVPSQVLSGLQNLQGLDLHDNQLNGSLPSSLKKLVYLQYLDLSYNLMEGSIPARIFADLVSLKLVDLSYNLFGGHFSFSSFANLSKLEFIKFSNNEKLFIHLDGGNFLPSFQLRFLMLSHCNLDADTLATPTFLASQYTLKFLDLSGGNLTGNLPNWLFENLTRLSFLNLRNNKLMGELQFPKHLKTNISIVDLSTNILSGSIPANIGTIFPWMNALNLSSNHLTGKIPSSLGSMSHLTYLDLSHNDLSGKIPTRLMIDCTELYVLKLSNNSLRGKLPGTIPRHPSLTFVHLDGNNFTGKLWNFVKHQKNLVVLDVHNNQLSGVIPKDIGRLRYLNSLNLAGNYFHGHIPQDLCNLQDLRVLDLSHNNLSGTLPHPFQALRLMYVKFAGNALTGTIPSSYFNNPYLILLDAGDNQLLGKLPRQMGEELSLEILVLGGNSLEGPIPIELCKLQSLHILDLSQNNLSGSIPSCFGKMDFKEADSKYYTFRSPSRYSWEFFMDGMPYSSPYKDVYEYIDGNSDEILAVELITKGHLYAYAADHLLPVSTIDLSSNKLTGNIPPEIGNLDELVYLNLSHNRLTGPIPETFSNLSQLESLDISHNQLSGVIPWQLTRLNFLGFFSVAYNKLSGCTPDFIGQFGTFTTSSYEGNIGLHGLPLDKICTFNSRPTAPPEVDGNQDDSSVEDDAIFFAILAASFVVGFWGCIAFLLCHHTGRLIRSILDGFVDSLTERILMAAHKRTRMRRDRR